MWEWAHTWIKQLWKSLRCDLQESALSFFIVCDKYFCVEMALCHSCCCFLHFCFLSLKTSVHTSWSITQKNYCNTYVHVYWTLPYWWHNYVQVYWTLPYWWHKLFNLCIVLVLGPNSLCIVTFSKASTQYWVEMVALTSGNVYKGEDLVRVI